MRSGATISHQSQVTLSRMLTDIFIHSYDTYITTKTIIVASHFKHTRETYTGSVQYAFYDNQELRRRQRLKIQPRNLFLKAIWTKNNTH